MTDSLFGPDVTDEPREYDDPELGHVIEIPATIQTAMAVFLNRWCYCGHVSHHRRTIERELLALIDFAKEHV